ncbi:MAG: hypothetical protein HY599_00045 [Candidatus Omnitrophica bacterium]|nr:hypothetical protein [Candidatus Omnitrophota bacterium]
MGRSARGVRGIRLGKGDEVIAMGLAEPKTELLTVTTLGFGKRSPIEEYRIQSRGGKGIINIKVTKKNGGVVGAKTVADQDELMLLSQEGMMVRCPVKDVRSTGRATQGVRLINIKGKDRLASVACVVPKEKEEGEEPPKPADPGNGGLEIASSPKPSSAETVEQKAKRLSQEPVAEAAPVTRKPAATAKPAAKPKSAKPAQRKKR